MLTLNDNKLKNTTIITGVGRSGTTFLAHVFHNAGYDLGAGPESIGLDIPDGGFEHYNTTRISRSECTDLLDEYPPIIKDPTFALALPKWLSLGQCPRHAIFTARDMTACYESISKYGPTTRLDLMYQWYTGLRNMLSAGIPVTIIPFPEIGTNPVFAEQLKPWIPNPWEIIQTTFDKTKVHHAPKQ